MIGYSDFISCEQFFIAWGADTRTHTHTHTYTHTHTHTHTHAHTRIHPHRSDFKKPGALRPARAWFKNFGILLLTTSQGCQSGIFIFKNKKLIHIAKILETVAHDNPNLLAMSCSKQSKSNPY